MIGIFDSGLGGLSVLVALRRLLPDAGVVYVADQARAPYGEKPADQVRSFSVELSAELQNRGADTVVVACNTASAAALHHLRRVFTNVNFVGIEPAVKPAALATQSGVIGVLATRGTLDGELFADLVRRHANGSRVLRQDCPGLVELVEDGLADTPQAADLLLSYVSPLLAEGADTLVLGCSHYPFLKDTLREIAPEVTLIDSSEAVAKQTARVATASPGPVIYATTGDPVRMRRQLVEIFGIDAPVDRILLR